MSEIDRAILKLHYAMQATDLSVRRMQERAAKLHERFNPVAVARREFNNWAKSEEGRGFKLRLREQQQGYCACNSCNANHPLGIEYLEIDHIKPLSKFPELALEPKNLQLLCAPCNKRKSAKV